MSLEKIVLQKLANWRPDSGQTALEVADLETGWSVRLTADCVEQLGCRLQALVVQRLAQKTGADLKSRAEALCSRVTGLLEPLRLIEIDPEQQIALPRSQAPSQNGETLSYYEARLQANGTCSLQRYQASQRLGSQRQRVAFTLTHESLGKLLKDLSSAS